MTLKQIVESKWFVRIVLVSMSILVGVSCWLQREHIVKDLIEQLQIMVVIYVYGALIYWLLKSSYRWIRRIGTKRPTATKENGQQKLDPQLPARQIVELHLELNLENAGSA